MPFKSQAQRRFMYAAASRGDIPRSTVKEWERATPKGKKLPEKVKKAAADRVLCSFFDELEKIASDQELANITRAAFLDELEKIGMDKEAVNPMGFLKNIGSGITNIFKGAPKAAIPKPAVPKAVAAPSSMQKIVSRPTSKSWSAGRSEVEGALKGGTTAEQHAVQSRYSAPVGATPHFNGGATQARLSATAAPGGWTGTAGELPVKPYGKGYGPESTRGLRMEEASTIKSRPFREDPRVAQLAAKDVGVLPPEEAATAKALRRVGQAEAPAVGPKTVITPAADFIPTNVSPIQKILQAPSPAAFA